MSREGLLPDDRLPSSPMLQPPTQVAFSTPASGLLNIFVIPMFRIRELLRHVERFAGTAKIDSFTPGRESIQTGRNIPAHAGVHRLILLPLLESNTKSLQYTGVVGCRLSRIIVVKTRRRKANPTVYMVL